MRPLSVISRTGTALVAAAVLAVLSAGTAHASQVEAYDADFPDPFVLPSVQSDGTTRYYAYATNTAGVAAHVQMISSTDLRSWTPPTEVLQALPAWASPGHTWAPAVLAVGTTHVLYYTTRHTTSNRQCISVAVSTDGPGGPFVDSSTEPLVCQLDLGGSIDPDAFRDPATGALFLHWKSDENAIGGVSRLWGAALSSNGLTLDASWTPLMKYDQRWEKPLIEAPQMVHADGGYHLFYSGNWWESENAAVGYGLCKTPLSECVKKMTTGPWLKKDRVRVGPAGETFFTKPDGSQLVAYHAWEPGKVGYSRGGKRSLWINSVSFATGKPVLTK